MFNVRFEAFSNQQEYQALANLARFSIIILTFIILLTIDFFCPFIYVVLLLGNCVAVYEVTKRHFVLGVCALWANMKLDNLNGAVQKNQTLNCNVAVISGKWRDL